VAPEVPACAKKERSASSTTSRSTAITAWSTGSEQAKALHGYGWVDRSKGVIHIPIDEAMKDVVARQARRGRPK
jgi:hypothetical protein